MSQDVPDVVVFALVVVVTVSSVALPVAALGGSPTAVTAETSDRVAPQTTANGTVNGSEPIAPGQRLAGVVGVQGAEIDSEIDERTLATRVDRAESNASKAAVVATELNTARDRLHDLRERQSALREARRSGELSAGEYRARIAVTAAQIRAVQAQLDSSETVSSELPERALESRGVTRGELDRLREEAAELRGPEVAEIAREIAGDDGGREFDPERGPDELPEPARDDDEDESETADEPGPPDDRGNGSASPGNRSTSSGPPEETGRSDGGDDSADAPGNSDDAGNGSDGSADAPGNSGDAGNGSDSDGSADAPGNSDDAGNGSDDSDDSADAPGNSDDAGNGASGGNDDDSPGNRGGGNR